MEELAPDEFLGTFVALLGELKGSFNSADFPNKTLNKIDVLLQFKKTNLSKVRFYDEEFKDDLLDAIIEIEERILKFKRNILSGSLKIAIERKDFVAARKTLDTDFVALIIDIDKTKITRLKDFKKLKKMFGMK